MIWIFSPGFESTEIFIAFLPVRSINEIVSLLVAFDTEYFIVTDDFAGFGVTEKRERMVSFVIFEETDFLRP